MESEGAEQFETFRPVIQPDLPMDLPSTLPVPEPTGEPRVDAALDRLAELAGAPVAEHVEVFADIHARLTGALADLGESGSDHSTAVPE